MNFLKNVLADKVRLTIFAISILFDLVAFVLYLVSQNIMSSRVNVWLVLVVIIAIAIKLAVLLFKDFNGILLSIAAALDLLGIGLFVSSQLGNLGYYLAGITDIGYGIMPTFVIGIIFYILALLSVSILVFRKENNLKEKN